MPEVFRALVESVNQTVGKLTEELEETQEALYIVQQKIDQLPKDYVPRTEAETRAKRVKRTFWGAVSGIVVSGLVVAGLGVDLNYRFLNACYNTRHGLQAIINTAVADRQPLPTSSPETRAAIDVQNVQIRELRAQLLALPSVNPDNC